MITLYVKTGCPFCAKAIVSLKANNILYEEKNIADPAVAKELIEIGGKRQVPFMEDDNMTPYLIDDDVEMYESDDIVSYIDKKYGKGDNNAEAQSNTSNLHVEDDSNICESCE